MVAVAEMAQVRSLDDHVPLLLLCQLRVRRPGLSLATHGVPDPPASLLQRPVPSPCRQRPAHRNVKHLLGATGEHVRATTDIDIGHVVVRFLNHVVWAGQVIQQSACCKNHPGHGFRPG